MKTWKWPMATIIPLILTAPASAKHITRLQPVMNVLSVSSAGNNLFFPGLSIPGSSQDTIPVVIIVPIEDTGSGILENDITFFTARQKDVAVELQWISRNETDARFYTVEVSTDGLHFAPVGQVAANPDATGTGRYHYQYPLSRLASGKHLFRIQMTELNYSVKYSPIRYVDVSPTVLRQPLLYPNPTSGQANIQFSNQAKSDWEVSVYTITGHLLQQYRFSNTLTAAINADRSLFKGTYIISAVNRKTGQQVVERLVIE